MVCSLTRSFVSLLFMVAVALPSSMPARAQESAASQSAEWELLSIPESWKKGPGGRYAAAEGYAWYRCVVKPPAAWDGKNLELFVEAVDDAREVFFNGRHIGSVGTFPPEYRSGLGISLRFPIKARDVLFGQENVVAIRVYQNYGRSGFNVAAPVLFGPEEAIRLTGKWQAAPGDDLAWCKLSVRSEIPADASFDRVIPAEEAERTLKKLSDEEGPLPTAEALKRFQTADDLTLELALSEPHIGQPLSIKWDERGRLWVMQYLQYPDPAGLKMVSRDKYLRTVWDKVPPPPPHHFRGQDKITIHEDTNGDGRYDRHKTFVDGLNLATSFAIGRGGVWVLNPPYLLFYPDGDGDDVPDGDPEVHLEGFGLEDAHSIANSLRWGPDGWLYAAQGSTVSGKVRQFGSEDKPVHSIGQLIWRYHPETRRYEVFAEGGGNAFGVEIDSKGRVYSGHNGGDTRGFHYVQGGYFRKGFGKHGELSNPFTFGYFEAMAHHRVPRFTHTFVIYESDGLPEPYRGKLFGVGPLQGHVVYSDFEPDRSSFKTEDLGHPLSSSDTWFRPVDIQDGPDGALYIADFYEQRIDHASHFQGRIDRETGRIYRLRGQSQPLASPDVDLAQRSTKELIGELRSENRWRRQTALRLIADRRDASAIPTLTQLLADETGQLALEALWALNLSGGLNEPVAAKLLDHADPYVRLWTVRLLCDEGRVSPEMADRLVKLAEIELNVAARSQLASSARRLPAEQSLPIVDKLLRRTEDATDVHVPLLLWWAIEDKADADRDQVLAMFADQGLWDEPTVRQHIVERLMRRYALAGTRRDLLTCGKLLRLAPSRGHAETLLAGFEAAYKGRSLANLPDELLSAMAEVGGGSLALRLRRGDEQAIDDALAIIGDEAKDAAERVMYAGIFGDVREPRAAEVLLRLATTSKSNDVRAAALTALQAYDDPQIGTRIVEALKQMPAATSEVAFTLLASRPTWAAQLLAAVDDQQVDADQVSLTVVRKILLHRDEQIQQTVTRHWGSVQGATTAEMQQQIERYLSVIQSASGNPYTGKTLFREACGKCHTLFSEGGQIGPDLTSYKRDDLRGMIVHVVNPSLEIREGFENYVVLTDDGRALNGFIADQDNQVVVLKGVDGQSLVIPRDTIEEMVAIPQSVMPEGILTPLTDQQVRDLFAYLRAAQPLP